MHEYIYSCRYLSKSMHTLYYARFYTTKTAFVVQLPVWKTQKKKVNKITMYPVWEQHCQV